MKIGDLFIGRKLHDIWYVSHKIQRSSQVDPSGAEGELAGRNFLEAMIPHAFTPVWGIREVVFNIKSDNIGIATQWI